VRSTRVPPKHEIKKRKVLNSVWAVEAPSDGCAQRARGGAGAAERTSVATHDRTPGVQVSTEEEFDEEGGTEKITQVAPCSSPGAAGAYWGSAGRMAPELARLPMGHVFGHSVLRGAQRRGAPASDSRGHAATLPLAAGVLPAPAGAHAARAVPQTQHDDP